MMQCVDEYNTGCGCCCTQNSDLQDAIDQLREEMLTDINISANVDDTIGNPHVSVVKDGNNFTFNFSGLKGSQGVKGDTGLPGKDGIDGTDGRNGSDGHDGSDGDNGIDGADGRDGQNGITPNILAEAHVDNTVGDPSVRVTREGTITNPVFHFTFSGIKGANGADGRDGVDGLNGADGTNGSSVDEAYIIGLIDAERDRVTEFIDELDGSIQTKVETLFADAQWWQQHYPGETGGGGSVSNFGQQDVKQYLQTLGLWFTNDSVTQTTWSTIKQNFDGIYADVQQLKANQSAGGEIDYEALSGSLYNYLTGDTITTGMQSTWARFLTLDNSEIQMLEWMAAGARAQANSQSAVADLFAAAKNSQNNQTAYAGLNTRVQTIESNYVTSTNLTSTVQSQVSSSISGIFTQNSSNSAVAALYSRVSAVESKTSSNQSAVAACVTSSGLDNATAALFSSNSSTKSSISTLVDGKISTATIRANQIQNLGQTVITTLNSSSVVISNGTINVNKVETGTVQDNGELFLISGEGNLVLASTNTNTPNTGGTLSNLYLGQHSGTRQYFNKVYINTYSGIESTHDVTVSSDETLKDIISDINLSVENIASTRTVNYKFKDNPDNIYSGAIAQDWQTILPNVVNTNDEGKLGLNYSSAALISSVVDAREIVKLKQENAELKERLAAIEARLAQL